MPLPALLVRRQFVRVRAQEEPGLRTSIPFRSIGGGGTRQSPPPMGGAQKNQSSPVPSCISRIRITVAPNPSTKTRMCPRCSRLPPALLGAARNT